MQRQHEEGQALVELAITMPLLCLILLGATELARAAYAAIIVTNAARTAVQYGASSHSNAQDWSLSGSTYSGGIVNAVTSESSRLTGSNAVSVTSISTACSCSNSSATPSSCTDNQTCANNNSAMLEKITVRTKATYTPLFRYFGYGGTQGPLTYTLYGRATQMVENQ